MPLRALPEALTYHVDLTPAEVLARLRGEAEVQVLEGLSVGDQIVLYSAKTLSAKSRINIVDRLPGVSP